MPDIKDNHSLHKWLTGQPREVSIANAARCALRGLLHWRGHFENSGRKSEATGYVLALFRSGKDVDSALTAD